ncbi:MAG TPA: DUF1684 domain-containing protein [Kineosporiaceae bacterium]|nr:DUF1684 domain-containing protein [Kineosporiaceae bacterium]
MALTLLDWRRQVAALYAGVRAADTPEQGHALWREGRDRLFRDHPDSPLEPEARTHFAGLPVAPYDPALRCEVDLDTTVEPRSWQVATDGDGVVPFSRLGVASLPGLGDLDVWWLESYGGGVFVPVRDPSPDTYGGGRYLLDTVKGADLGGDAVAGRLVLDLNFAYNPSCAYSPAWTCPLAPPGNTLQVALPGGERA